MARPPFDPEKASPPQKMALAAVDAARAAYERARENLQKAYEAGRDQKIPNPYLEKRVGMSKSKFYRDRKSGSAHGANGEQD